jgi:hypothetical protein
MGANRPGTRRKQKEKRFKKEIDRLIKKAEKEATSKPVPPVPQPSSK